MKVALIGATGPVGKRILAELVERGHRVTAIVRDVSRVPAHENVHAVSADIGDQTALADAVRGHEAAIFSVRFTKSDVEILIGAMKDAGVSRFLSVGGAGSLYVPGTKTKIIDSGQIPEEWRSEPLAGSKFFMRLEQEQELEWIFMAPPMMFSNDEQFGTDPGGRTGKYRLGGEELLVDENGQSTISYEDYAVAMVDELEQNRHLRQRFTVAY